jgi:hypothetical protein
LNKQLLLCADFPWCVFSGLAHQKQGQLTLAENLYREALACQEAAAAAAAAAAATAAGDDDGATSGFSTVYQSI